MGGGVSQSGFRPGMAVSAPSRGELQLSRGLYARLRRVEPVGPVTVALLGESVELYANAATGLVAFGSELLTELPSWNTPVPE